MHRKEHLLCSDNYELNIDLKSMLLCNESKCVVLIVPPIVFFAYSVC